MPTGPVTADPDFDSIPHGIFRPQTLPAYLAAPPPPPPTRPKAPWDAPPRRKSSSGNLAVWIIVGWFSAMLFVGICGTIAYVVYNTAGMGRAEMSIAGFTASAPGRVASRNSTMSANEVGILNPRTGSQFQLIFVPSPGGRAMTADMFITGLKRLAPGTTSSPVTRLGMSGYHFDSPGGFNSADGEGEVFGIPGGVLVIVYQPGSSLARVRSDRKAKYSGERERSIDGVDQFFESLARQSNN
jgi:hypothetical protein